MRVSFDFDVKKWCVYNEKNFELEVREDAPEEIKEKFKKWKETYDERFEI